MSFLDAVPVQCFYFHWVTANHMISCSEMACVAAYVVDVFDSWRLCLFHCQDFVRWNLIILRYYWPFASSSWYLNPRGMSCMGSYFVAVVSGFDDFPSTSSSHSPFPIAIPVPSFSIRWYQYLSNLIFSGLPRFLFSIFAIIFAWHPKLLLLSWVPSSDFRLFFCVPAAP